MSEEIMELSKEQKQSMIVKLDSINTLDEMLSFAKVLVDSKIIPLTSPEKVVVAYQLGKELGLGVMTAMNNIHIISNKPTLSVHACMALLKKANIAWETVEDYENVTLEYTDEQGNVKSATTKRTTIIFHYVWEGMKLKEKVSFTWHDAIRAGYSTKDNWVKMPKQMMWNRCAVMGARRVAPNALLGMYEATEIADSSNVVINLDESGNPV